MTNQNESEVSIRDKARSGRAEITKAAKKGPKQVNTEDSPAVAAARAAHTKAKNNSPCNAMLASKLGTLKRMNWKPEEAFVAISALRTDHQGGSATESRCPKKCLHSDERLAGMVIDLYEKPVLPWNDDYERVMYIERQPIGRDEAFLLLIMTQLTDAHGYNKRFIGQNDLLKITHMHKSEMVNAIRKLHNKGIITIKLGYTGKASEYWLHEQPVLRHPEDMIEITETKPNPKKSKSPAKTKRKPKS